MKTFISRFQWIIKLYYITYDTTHLDEMRDAICIITADENDQIFKLDICFALFTATENECKHIWLHFLKLVFKNNVWSS